MNEKFKLLALEAQMGTADFDAGSYYVATPDRMQTLCELIVKECMNIARNVGNISEPDDWAKDRCYEIEQRIQDRFGVEE
jgi:hypothetical protein